MMRHQSSIAISLLSLSVIAGVISAAPSVAEPILKVVKPAAAGRTTGSLANTILSGNVAPKSTLGIDGDFYIDIKALNIYGPKVSGKWPAAISLRGATGATGAPGAMGLDGDDGAIGKTGAPSLVAGAPGSAGAVGATGPKGEAGASGAVGPPGISGGPGAIGATGPSGAPGMAGTAGSPGAAGTQGATGGQGIQGVQGSKGDAGVQGEKGLQGNAGIKGDAGSTGGAGVKGDTGLQGATGAAGPSSANSGLITFASTISGGSGTSQPSNSFGTFTAGQNYLIRIYIDTWNAGKILTTYPVTFQVAAVGSSPILTSSFVVANGSDYATGSAQTKVGIIADVLVDGSATAEPFNLVVTISVGTNTGTTPITLGGRFFRTLIGQIG